MNYDIIIILLLLAIIAIILLKPDIQLSPIRNVQQHGVPMQQHIPLQQQYIHPPAVQSISEQRFIEQPTHRSTKRSKPQSINNYIDNRKSSSNSNSNSKSKTKSKSKNHVQQTLEELEEIDRTERKINNKVHTENKHSSHKTTKNQNQNQNQNSNPKNKVLIDDNNSENIKSLNSMDNTLTDMGSILEK
ncbi:MAG: hypothetical protein Gaeavirus22_3 [Gaeavirus sp.]|uniref:Uncharacterized protein n=1 Tax=Gaeavirus sp. TaxID=2487767 RepID=A0A3G4ZZ97_9VIRU|nr:MAG: hypothetical protein Gaeavirus22_3 [Gaeavirus sp.]